VQLKVHFNPAWRRSFPPGDRRLWLLRAVALRIQLQANPLWIFEVYHRRLLVALGGLTAVLWLVAATALFVWLDREPHNQASWADLAAPWRWSSLRTKRGDAAVLTALDQLKDGDSAAGFYNLRVGVTRSPANVEGRLALAALQAGGEPARAVAFLEEGLPLCGTSTRYLGGLLSLYSRLQIQTHALAVIDGLLQGREGALPPDARFILQRAQAVILLQLARYPEVERALAALTPPTADDAASLQSLRIEFLLRAGRAAEAKQLHDANPGPAEADDSRLRQAAEIALALDDADALQGALRRMKARAPDDPSAYLFAFQAWHKMKRLSYRDATEQEYFRTFADNDSALQAIAALAVNLDLPDVIARAQRVAVAARHSAFAFRVHQTELALRRGEFELATGSLRDWENNIDTLKAPQRFYPEFIKRLARTAFSGTPDQLSYLLSHIAANRGQMQLSVYGLAVSVLEKAGNLADASAVLQAALDRYPQSEPLLVARDRIDAQLAAKSAAASVAASSPPAGVVLPATANEARARIDALLQQEALAEVRDLLRAIRTQKPDWQAGLEAELAVREVELAFLTLDPLASRSAVRTYVDRYHGEPDLLRLVALAGRLAARGRGPDARLLSDEVMATHHVTAAVQRALRDLNLSDDLAAVAADRTATLAALDRGILGQDWTQAERLLKYLRDRPPAWLSAAQTDLKVREVQIRLGLDQRLLALGVLKELVIKAGAPRAAAFKLVRDLLGRRENDAAVLLAREIVRLLPEDPAAARLLVAAEAPRPAE
jgi:hypothetical protein